MFTDLISLYVRETAWNTTLKWIHGWKWSSANILLHDSTSGKANPTRPNIAGGSFTLPIVTFTRDTSVGVAEEKHHWSH